MTFSSGADFEAHTATCPSCNDTYLMDAHWKKVCLKCYLKTKGKTYAPPHARQVAQGGATIEPDMLRRLLQLCHPDRHAGSQAALLATQWLLQLRGQQNA